MPRLSAHVLAPAVAALLSLALPFASPGESRTVGAAASVTATAAQADTRPADQRFPIGGPDLQRARQVATAHWGADACGGSVELSWATLGAGTNATAAWRNPSDAWGDPGENFDCRIELNVETDYDFAQLCTVLAHEIGHLLGRRHAEREGELMSPYYSSPLAACVQAAPASARAATPVRPSARARKRCLTRLRAGRRVKRCAGAPTAHRAAARSGRA